MDSYGYVHLIEHISLMTEPNFIILIDLDSGKTALQNCSWKINKNNGFKS